MTGENRPKASRVALYHDKSGWHGRVYDTAGSLRSTINHASRAYVDRWIADYFPHCTVEEIAAPQDDFVMPRRRRRR